MKEKITKEKCKGKQMEQVERLDCVEILLPNEKKRKAAEQLSGIRKLTLRSHPLKQREGTSERMDDS